MPRKKAQIVVDSTQTEKPLSLAQTIELQLAPTRLSDNELLTISATDENLKLLQDTAAPFALIEGVPTKEQRDEAAKIKSIAVSVRTRANKVVEQKAKPYADVVSSLKAHAKYIGAEAMKAQVIVEAVVDRYEDEQQRIKREKINEQENKINKRKEQLINLGFKYDGEIGYVLDAYRMENIDVRQMPDKQFERAIFEYTAYVDTIAENKRLAAEQLENDKQQLQRDREQLRKDQKALEQQKAAQVAPEKLDSIVTQLSGDIAPELKKPTVLEQLVHQGFGKPPESMLSDALQDVKKSVVTLSTFPMSDAEREQMLADNEWALKGPAPERSPAITAPIIDSDDALTAAMIKNSEDYSKSEANRVDDMVRHAEAQQDFLKADAQRISDIDEVIFKMITMSMLTETGRKVLRDIDPYLQDVRIIIENALQNDFDIE